MLKELWETGESGNFYKPKLISSLNAKAKLSAAKSKAN